VAYRADIEIGVKGVRSLEQLRSEINKSATAAESLNNVVGGRGGLVQSIQNYVNNLNTASRTLSLVTAGTRAETKAVQEYVTALGQANTARSRQNALIDAEIKRRQEIVRLQKLSAAGIFETTRFRQPIGPQPSPLQGQASLVGERIARTLAQRKDEADLQKALLALEQRKASELNKQLQIRGELNAAVAREVNLLRAGIRPSTQYTQPIGPQLARNAGRTRAGGGVPTGRLGGVVSNAVIGGAFPLLFGQGGGAATGGALGGAIGGLLGGTGGFAGSLLGTLLGGIAEQGAKVKELAADIGFTAQQTIQLQQAFKLAGADAEKFTAAVQNIRGLGLELSDQASIIQALTQLTASYGGSIDKTSTAFTSALESGKVTQATLNQLTSQGIPIQEKLASTYNVSRSELLQMAKDGKISVQDLADAFVNLANESAKGPTKARSAYAEAFTQIQLAVDNLTAKIKESFNIQTNEATKTAETLALRFSKAFSDILKSIEPVILLLSATTGALVNLGIQAGNALAGVPGLISGITTQIIGMIPGLGAAYKILAGIASLRGGNQRGGVASPLNLNQGMDANWPEGVSRPGTAPTIARITAPGQMAASGGGGAKRDRSAENAAREAARVAEVIRDRMAETEMLRIQGQLQEKISNAELVKDASLVARLNGEKEILDIQYRYAQALANEKNINAQQAIVQEGLQAIENSRLNTLLKVEEIEAQRTEKYTDLLTKFDREIELAGVKDEAAKKLRQIEFDIIDLRKQGILLTEEEITAYRNRAVAAAGTGTQGPGQKRMEELKAELAELTNLESVAVLAADNMGNAFGQAFQEIINGSSSAQEALANMMRSIGENFINMAAQIIAKQTTMMILGTILKALGIFSGAATGGGFSSNAAGFGGSVDAGIPALPGIPDYSGAFRANGGPVSAGSPYVVGEHGPELFVPGRNGSVVSNSGLRDAMGAAPGSGGSPVLNMSFQTTSIGGVEYVSRDQLEAAMAETRRQATRDGASRGMTMTLDRIKQSPQTRSRIGIR
jgi:tape measure domain-containing protein